jgi:hypothetical protein
MPWVPILPNPRIGSSLLLFGYPGSTPDTTPISLSFWANLCEEIGQYESLTLWFSWKKSSRLSVFPKRINGADF